MTPDQLKASILQLAIQGKLVPQRPDEGTAEDLYQQIQREKKKLAAAGKLKKEKPLPPISEEEIPFDIPDSWKWVRGRDVVNIISGTSYAKNDERQEGIRIIRGGNVKQGKVNLHDDDVYIDERLSDPEKTLIQGDIVIIGSTGSSKVIGNAGFVEKSDATAQIGAFLRILRAFCPETCGYLNLIFQSSYYKEHIVHEAKGTNINNIKASYINDFLIPLPPLGEQRRIVEKLEQMLPLEEQYGEAYTALESLDARFPDDMRKSILQYAIQGKLVPQRPEEGTAEDLYQQIQKEKKKLIAVGKLKKEKPLPPISEDEIPFDIPDSWKWVHMGDIFAHNTGKAQNSTAETRNGILRKFITTSNVYWNRFDFSKVKEMLFTENEIEKCTVQKGDLLVCEGGDCGRAAIWQDDESMCIQNHIHRLRPYVGVEIMFFYYVFWLLKQTGYLNGKGVGIKGLSSNTLHKLPCPLPTLAEQRRIVEKMGEIPPIIS